MLNKAVQFVRKLGGRHEVCVYCLRPITSKEPRVTANRGPAHLACVRYSR